jgi:predicted AlkP superfamily pyrophosphatase or phosphodiesterase
MKTLLRVALLSLFLAVAACAPVQDRPTTITAAETRAPVTILISIDGFRPDYMGKGDTPNLDTLAKTGVLGRMRPSFPVLTFPNHEAMITGKRPDHSGIVANTMYDPRKPDVKFTISDPKTALDPFWWQEAEPLWVTAQKAGVRTSIMFWPGSEVAIGDVRAQDWLRYDANFTGEQRVRTVMDWLRRPVDIRPQFVTLYFDTVDKTGHKQGPHAPATIEAVRQVDRRIGDLRTGLATLGQPANLVIVSDHGMRDIDPAKAVVLDTLLPRDAYRMASYGPFASIDPLPGKEKAVEAALLKPNPDMQCWRKADVPARYHYGAHARVAAVLCLAVAGGEILPVAPTDKGDHGYDPDDPEMAALFLATGPAIHASASALPVPFDNVDLYPFLARLIGVTPLPGDGNPATLDALAAAP